MKNRTGIDFSKHEVHVISENGLLVHYLKKPDTVCDAIKYINTNGIMAVTGDYGNWIFCREFHPDAKTNVSDGYWFEKLRVASSQVGDEFDSERTKEEIEKGINGGLVEYGFKGDKLEKALEYFQGCLDHVQYSEFEYTAYAFQEMPGFFDSEMVPFCKRYQYWLLAVYDGFDEMCNRLRESEVPNG
ncbi:MAG: hypothetical protein EOP49_18980 [Sphingobacteriales bacterium]|nr:MAG: hypothetical protein EOP49_18980 [Sphingobacteriales bacterium]